MGSVRNFWLHADVDGRRNPIDTGPKAPDGTMRTVLSIRNKGRSEIALKIYCSAHDDGTLGIAVYDHKGDLIHIYETTR